MSLEMDMEETDGKSAGDEVKCKSCSASLMPAVTYRRFAEASLFCGWNWKLWPTLSRFLHDPVVHALPTKTPTNTLCAELLHQPSTVELGDTARELAFIYVKI